MSQIKQLVELIQKDKNLKVKKNLKREPNYHLEIQTKFGEKIFVLTIQENEEKNYINGSFNWENETPNKFYKYDFKKLAKLISIWTSRG